MKCERPIEMITNDEYMSVGDKNMVDPKNYEM